MLGRYVIEPQRGGHELHSSNFLTDAVDEMKMYVGEHDGQWQAGQAAAGAHIEHAAALRELHYLGNAQRVQQMALFEIIHVGPRH